MKNYYKILILAFVAATAFISCEEYLDVSPELGISSEQVFTDYYSTRGVVDRANRLVQNYVYDQHDWACEVGSMSDEGQVSHTKFPGFWGYNSGNWMNQGLRELGGMTLESRGAEFHGSDLQAEPTSKAFIAIRAVSTVIENIELLTDYPDELGYTSQQLKDQLLGQSYFLRGFHYFQIIRRYGGFPIMRKSFTPDHTFDEVRPSYLMSTDSLVADLDIAIQMLPEKWNAQNLGRATKSSARALKAMALLYAASPLMNPDLNPYGSSSKNYNVEYAKKAATAAVEAIDGYSAGGYEMFTMENYTDNWYSRTSGFPKESVFQAPLSRHSDPNTSGEAGKGWYHPQFEGGWLAEVQPTQNAVDWFETADGYDVNDPEAISSGSLDPNNPYENRDPRLKTAVWVHGDDMYEGFSDPSGGPTRDLQASPTGWHYKFEKGKGKFWSGYYLKKLKWPGADKWHKAKNYYRTYPHIRVPQLYLDFAEAANEAYGPNGAVPGTSFTAVSAINLVRERAGMPAVLAKYAGSKDEFRKRIYNERAVELYFEFHRWFDLRRWNLAKEVLAEGGIYAADIREVDGTLVYGKKKLDGAVRVFEDKHYWYPFPTAVMDMMSEFKQNPGW